MSIVTSNQKLGIKKAAHRLAGIETGITVNDFKEALTESVAGFNEDEKSHPVTILVGTGKKQKAVIIEYFELGNNEALRLTVDNEVSYLNFSGERGK